MKSKKLNCRAILLAAVFIFSANNALAYVLSAGKDGGDCGLIGSWEKNSKTCTLNRDISHAESSLIIDFNKVIVLISGNGITLDGNGHSIIGSGLDSEMGIYISKKQRLTVKNLTVTGCAYGIFLTNKARRNTVSDVSLTNNMYGISITTGSDNNSVTGVNASGNSYAGIFLGDYVKKMHINDNSVVNNLYGILLYGTTNSNAIINNIIEENSWGASIGFESEKNTVMGNTFLYNDLALFLNSATNNNIYRNNFIGHVDRFGDPIQGLVSSPQPNTFSQPMPTGGNYWSYYDTPKEGCSDSNSDGICDQPRVLTGSPNSDMLPWTTMNGWVK